MTDETTPEPRPLPEVHLPPINRDPVADRSDAGYLANTPGLAPAAEGGADVSDATPEAGDAAPDTTPAASGSRGRTALIVVVAVVAVVAITAAVWWWLTR